MARIFFFIILFLFSFVSQTTCFQQQFKTRYKMQTTQQAIFRPKVELPEKLIVGYASWNQCDELLVRACEQGVNVLIWFSINLDVDSSGSPNITNGPPLDCVREIIRQINELNLPTIHLISIGGWNSPHPDTSNPVEVIYDNWLKWNDDLFDGIDWDIEGNDDMSSPYNHFTLDCLDLMGQFSQLAKRDGFVVAMAPAESYLDPTTSTLDLDLNHSYPEWEALQPNFKYHGHNVYGYLLYKYGTTNINATEPTVVDTFDFVTVQLYEGYSHAEYAITVMQQSPESYIREFVQSMYNGWNIQFNLSCDDSNQSNVDLLSQSLPRSAFIRVPKTQLVVGLANGWAGDGKFLLIYPDRVGASYIALKQEGLEPLGYAFWCIKDEGIASPSRPHVPVWMASGLNDFLHVRK